MSLPLKIFIPDITDEIDSKTCSPLLLPFFTNRLTEEERTEKFGGWTNSVEFVNDIHEANIAVPAHYVNYYFTNKRVARLKNINCHAFEAGKLTVCWTAGDWGITPLLENFHLYRNGGYRSKNKGNEFCYPFFLSFDPVERFFGNILPVCKIKPEKPVIGFCGRASPNILDSANDIAKNIRRFILHGMNIWHEDPDIYHGSSNRRFQMLEKIKQNNSVETNFICYRGFVGGLKSFKNAGEVNKVFYENMRHSHYIFCYRGWGNFSLRLYETLASGRIPVIIKSDNNLPFEDEINWDVFPVVSEKEYENIAGVVSSFHSGLSNHDFENLQYTARKIWENFFTYKSFMALFVKKYCLY